MPLKWFKPAEGQFKIHISHTAPPMGPGSGDGVTK